MNAGAHLSSAIPQISRRQFNGAVAAGALSLTFLSPALAQAATWEPIDDRDGISVFRMKLQDSPLHAFRGKAMIDAPMEKIMWVLSDNAHRTEWVDRLVKSVVLETKGNYESVLYQHYKTPPVVSDRDFVYRARAVSKADGTAVLEIASVTHPRAPATVGVRGELTKCSYVLKRSGKDRTHIDVIVMTDPKGSLPNWLINMIQKSWPRNTLLALRDQVNKPFVGLLPAPPIG